MLFFVVVFDHFRLWCLHLFQCLASMSVPFFVVIFSACGACSYFSSPQIYRCTTKKKFEQWHVYRPWLLVFSVPSDCVSVAGSLLEFYDLERVQVLRWLDQPGGEVPVAVLIWVLVGCCCRCVFGSPTALVYVPLYPRSNFLRLSCRCATVRLPLLPRP